jgi:hypothetical protein
MTQLVDIDTVKKHLRYDADFTDADETINIKIDQASSAILDYLKLEDAPDPVPGYMEAAACLAVEALYDGGDPLNDTVKALLHRSRDPELA